MNVQGGQRAQTIEQVEGQVEVGGRIARKAGIVAVFGNEQIVCKQQ